MNANWKEIGSLTGAILTVAAALYLGMIGQLPWQTALPLALAGLAVLGIHPTINTTPVAGVKQSILGYTSAPTPMSPINTLGANPSSK